MLTSESLKFINYLKNQISEIKDIQGFKELFNLLQNHKYNYENPVINTMSKSFIDYKPRFISENLYKQFQISPYGESFSDYIKNNKSYKKEGSINIISCTFQRNRSCRYINNFSFCKLIKSRPK